jgi:hypothetical protein
MSRAPAFFVHGSKGKEFFIKYYISRHINSACRCIQALISFVECYIQGIHIVWTEKLVCVYYTALNLANKHNRALSTRSNMGIGGIGDQEVFDTE